MFARSSLLTLVWQDLLLEPGPQDSQVSSLFRHLGLALDRITWHPEEKNGEQYLTYDSYPTV
jgi:hypothetical protein